MTNRRTFLAALGALAAAPLVPMPSLRPKPWQLFPHGPLETPWLQTVYPKALLDRLTPNMVFDQFMQKHAAVLGQNAALHLDQVALEAVKVQR